MSAESPSWPEVLEQLSRQLEAYRACLVGGEPPEPYHLPSGLGPIPPDLLDQARELHSRQQGVAVALEARRGRIGAELARRAGAGRPTRPPAFLDTRI